jgi:hypothetical protein
MLGLEECDGITGWIVHDELLAATGLVGFAVTFLVGARTPGPAKSQCVEGLMDQPVELTRHGSRDLLVDICQLEERLG